MTTANNKPKLSWRKVKRNHAGNEAREPKRKAMTPGQALRAIERGRRVKHVETGYVWERSGLTGRAVQATSTATPTGSNFFPAYGTFKLLKEKPAPWKPGEVRWQKNGDTVFRYEAMESGRLFSPNSSVGIEQPWSDRADGEVIDITPEEGLHLIHEMGWNEDGTRYTPAPTLDELRKLVSEDPRVGDVVTGARVTRAVKAVTPELVAYTCNKKHCSAMTRAQWATICKAATKIERAKV